MTREARGMANMATKQEKEAGLVMGTNSSSIVSKRSVERIYYPEPHFFRHFVKKPQRRAPLINRGYWLRMHAIEQSVRQFLGRPSDRPKLVINFGCGFDPLPFQFLQHERDLCKDAKFLDIDHHKLMVNKRDMIRECKELNELIPDVSFLADTERVLIRGSQYMGIGCDLAEIGKLESALESEFNFDQYSIFCFAEVSLTYMETHGANAVLSWASKLSDDAQFCLLEQYFPDGPEHPFAKTMMKHFNKLRTPLYALWEYPSLHDQEQRFISCGWEHATARSLWDLWNDSEFLNDSKAESLDSYEAFDEWEEFAIFAAHYFLLTASTRDLGLAKEKRLETDVESDFQPKISPRLIPQCPAKFNGQRRFGAIVPIDNDMIGLYGGVGRQARLTSTNIYSRITVETAVDGMPSPTLTARMCHTITELNNSDCFLVGGRSSPTAALGDCWLRRAGEWRQAENLPVPVFRHNATAVKLPQGEEGVLVYGGKTSTGGVLTMFLLWREFKGWETVPVVGTNPEPRFGASFAGINDSTGILLGGLDKRGRVLHDFWTWTLRQSEDGAVSIEVDNKTSRVNTSTPLFKWLGRFGASTNVTDENVMVIGGISSEGFVPCEHEYVSIRRDSVCGLLFGTCNISIQSALISTSKVPFPRPLLVGHSSYTVDGNKILISGGGAVCFSFGTYWNEGTWIFDGANSSPDNQWLLLEPSTSTEQSPSRTVAGTIGQSIDSSAAPVTAIPRCKVSSAQEFQTIVDVARPVIIEGLDIGPCVSQWTKEYLEKAVGRERKIIVHDSPTDHMKFQTKNFSYVAKEFGTFLDEIHAGGRQYLRAISSEKPTELPANLSTDFPGLKEDFLLPTQLSLVSENAHSSPLRISGLVTLWLHYDVLANVLCQVRGEKRLILYPPWDVSRLGFPAGASSSSISVFQGTSDAAPVSPPGTNAHEAVMRPGDVLFIPPLWLHTASPTGDVSVAVNVFFRNLEAGVYAAGRDVYGNRDLQAYEKGRRDVEKVARSFDRLPRDVARFYLDRLADELKEKAST